MRGIKLFLVTLFLTGSLSAAEIYPFNQFSGLNTDDNPLQLQDGQTPESENVLTDEGPGIQGRKGFIVFSTEPASSLWEFPLSDGTRYIITKSGSNLKADTGDGTFNIQVSTVPSDRITAASVLGDRFYFADTLNGLKYWNGTSVVIASAALTVDNLVTWKGRLAASGVPANTRVIYLSKYLDGTTWAAPTNASEDDATQITVAGALDENIQALYASFQDKLMWFKSNSFGGIYGSRRSNFTQRTFSDYVGVSSKETIRDCDGLLRWLGKNRVVWEFDGSTFRKISEQVDNLFSDISQGDSSSKSNTQTTQSHFDAGTQSQAGFADTSIITGSLTPKTSTFLDTNSDGWSVGTSSPTGWFSTTLVAGSLSFATPTVSGLVDTTKSDFESGTLSALDSTTTVDQLILLRGAIQTQTEGMTGGVDTYNQRVGLNEFLAQQFDGGFLLSSATLRLRRTGSPPAMTVSLYTNIPGEIFPEDAIPGSLIQTFSTVDVNAVSTDFSDVTVTLGTPYAVASGTKYWLVAATTGTPDTSNNIGWGFDVDSAIGSNFTCGSSGCGIGDTHYYFTLTGSTYSAAGNIVSRTFDINIDTNSWIWNWTTFSPTSSIPTSTTITYQTQSSDDGSSWDSLTPLVPGNISTSTLKRYVRYKATFGTTVGDATPSLQDVTIPVAPTLRPGAVFLFTSRAFDTGFTTPAWGLVDFTSATVGAPGVSSFFTQASANGTAWDSSVAATDGQIVGSARKRYIRYLWSYTATFSSSSARLDDFTITSKSTGTFTTQAINVGNLISAWGPVNITLSEGGGSFTLQFGTSTNGTSFSYTTISNNATPTSSTTPYAAVRIVFDLDVATDTPRVDDITINWIEGSNVRAASTYFNQRYWLGVALDSSTNNRVFAFDKRRQWQRYSGINIDAITLYNSNLYFGNTSGIFQAESGYTDNGSSIASYYRTPTVSPSSLDLYSKFLWLYTTTDSSDSTLIPTYQVDGIDTDYSFGSSQMNATTGIQNLKFPFPVEEIQQGRYISLNWAVTGTSFWRILAGNLYFDRDITPQ